MNRVPRETLAEWDLRGRRAYLETQDQGVKRGRSVPRGQWGRRETRATMDTTGSPASPDQRENRAVKDETENQDWRDPLVHLGERGVDPLVPRDLLDSRDHPDPPDLREWTDYPVNLDNEDRGAGLVCPACPVQRDLRVTRERRETQDSQGFLARLGSGERGATEDCLVYPARRGSREKPLRGPLAVTV